MENKKNTYDAIIIGGGLSGLTCANYLALEGKKTLLLEQAHQVGGCMSGFRRKGFYFDGGDQSLESGGIAFQIFQELGVYDMHKWHKCEYRVKSPKRDFLVTSIDTVRENFEQEFPGEKGLKIVFDEIKEFALVFEDLMSLSVTAMENPKGTGKLLKIMPSMKKWTHPDYRAQLCSAVNDPTLRSWLSNYGYSHMPFHLFAGFWHFWVNDYWYPSGGIQSLMNNLAEKFKENGGEIRLKTPVKKITVDKGSASGVITGEDDTIKASNVVYTGDYKKLVSDILGKEHFKPAFAEKVRKARVVESFVAVYLGLDIPHDKLKELLKAHHVVRFPNFNFAIPGKDAGIDAHASTSVELSSPSFADPELAPPGKSSLVLQCITTAEWQNYWQNGGLDTKRTSEYEELKKKVAGQLIKTAEAVIPGLTSKIEYMDVSSPLTLNRYTWNTNGASAGWSHDQSKGNIVGRWGLMRLRGPVKGLYTAGHYTFWPGGIPSVTASGKFAASFILKKKPFAQIDKLMRFFGR